MNDQEGVYDQTGGVLYIHVHTHITSNSSQQVAPMSELLFQVPPTQ